MASKSAFSKTSLEAEQFSSKPDSQTMDPGTGDETSEHTSGPTKRALSGFVAARIELASIEAKEAAEFAAKKTVHAIILGICVFFFWSLILAGLTGVLSPVADKWLDGKIDWLPGWAAVLFALAIMHAVIAAICLICLKKKPLSPLFELSRQEIENDKQWLKNK